MKKVFLSLIFFLALIFCYNVEAISQKDVINEKKVIISLNKGYKYNKSLKTKIEKKLGIKIAKSKKINTNGLGNYYVLSLKSKVSNITKECNKLNKIKAIKKVQPSYKYSYEPNDKKKASTKASLIANNWHVEMVASDQLKNEVENTTSKVKVGVIDTGIDYNHPDLKDNINKSLSYNFIGYNSDASDDIGHGTHVAGLIAGNNDYSSGKNIEIVAYRALNDYYGETEDIVAAINHAQKNGVKVLNMSFGYDSGAGVDNLMYDAIANYDGVAVVAAGNSDYYKADYPAGFNLDNIISVGSMDNNGEKSSFSNYNSNSVDIFAPGNNVFSTCSISLYLCVYTGLDQYDEDVQLAKMSGTSMATPIVSGIAGTLYSTDSTLENFDVKNAIIDGAKESSKLKKMASTNGYVDAVNSLKLLKANNNKTGSYAKINVDGSVDLWGVNDKGQLGNGTTTNINELEKYNYKVTNDEIVKYYITNKNVFLVTKKGDLYVSGSNDYGQLGQRNSINSLVFVKFNKVSTSHKIEKISLRASNSLFDENSLTIYLSKSNGYRDYYKIGNESFKLNSVERVTSNKLQFIKYNKYGYIDYINFYKKNSNSLEAKEKYNYIKEYDEYSEEYYIYLDKTIITQYYNTYYTKYAISDYDETLTKYSNSNQKIKSTNSQFDKYYAYDYSTGKEKVYKYYEYKLIKNYKNNKIVNKAEYFYNDNNVLKLGATKYYYKYNKKGQLIAKKYATYNNNSKLSKYKTLYKAVYGSKKYTIQKASYNSKKQLTKNTKLIAYNKGDKKITYLKREYKNNKKSKEIIYKYNNKGQLKSNSKSKAYKYVKTYKKGKLIKTIKYTYNSKGKLTNKIVTANGGN